jgi:hypothetical protein
MKSFLERLAARDELGRVGRRCSFRDLGMGETAALSLSRRMRGGARIPHKQVAEKTSPGALERKKGFHGIRLFQLRMFYGVKAIIEYFLAKMYLTKILSIMYEGANFWPAFTYLPLKLCKYTT